METSKYEKYLPSKHFVKVFGICAAVLLVIFGISAFWGSHGIFSKNAALVETAQNGTVSDLISQDSNNNGIPDWQETLYGLDPKADGAGNKAIIEQKEASAGVETNSQPDQTNPNEQFSQELLATLISLQQSGSLNEESMTNLAASIGDSVDAKHVQVPLYTEADIDVVPDTVAAKNTYENQLKKVVTAYDDLDLGSELNIIANGLGDEGGAGAFSTLDDYSKAYLAIASGIVAIPTPTRALAPSLQLANTSLEMGTYLQQVEGMYTDALSGMVGLDDYIKASAASDKATQDMQTYLNS